MKRIILLLFTCINFLFVDAQIVNVESLRRATDSAKWSGNFSLDVGFIKNKNEVLRINNRINIQHRSNRNTYLFVNDLNFQKLKGNDFVNRGIQHFRYNYNFSSLVTWEAFLQGQYDAISNINFRGLIGAGPRFKFENLENYKFYLGTLIMYEHENTSDELNNIHKDFRASVYVAFKLYPKENISIVSTTYYQPKLNQLSDYRLSNETSIAFKIFKDLAYKASFTFLYDRFPVFDTPKTQYELTNGLVYSFD